MRQECLEYPEPLIMGEIFYNLSCKWPESKEWIWFNRKKTKNPSPQKNLYVVSKVIFYNTLHFWCLLSSSNLQSFESTKTVNSTAQKICRSPPPLKHFIYMLCYIFRKPVLAHNSSWDGQYNENKVRKHCSAVFLDLWCCISASITPWLSCPSTTTLTALGSFMIPFSHVTSCIALPVTLAFNRWLSHLFSSRSGTQKPKDEYEAVLMWTWYLVSFRLSWYSRASARTSFYWGVRDGGKSGNH